MAFTGENPAANIKKATTNQEIVGLLKDDMKGEHAAIIQYLQHSYKIGEDAGEIPSEIEGIARDEMRHFRWLGELIVEFGGDPTLERDPIFLDGPSAADLMTLDIDAEQRAIDQYREHIAAIDHPKVKLYLERILMDELFHQGRFREFVEEVGGEPTVEAHRQQDTGPWTKNDNPASQDLELTASGQAVPADLDNEKRNDHPLIKMLNNRIQQEYETILIYLHQAFISQNATQRNHLISDRAVWHMTHMGTLSEAVAGMEGHPEMELDFSQPFLKQAPTEAQAFRQWAAQREDSFVASDTELIETAGDADEELAADLRRIAGHDRFQAAQFKQTDESEA